MIIDALGLLLIGTYCLGCAIFATWFAKIHVQFPFFNFPIFISEWLFLLVLCLWLIKMVWARQWQRWHLAYALYFLWVVVNAVIGNYIDGPLALRHAAMFYYPCFALFGYSFYNSRFFTSKILLGIGLAVTVILVRASFLSIYFWYSFVVLGMLLIIKNFRKNAWIWVIIFLVCAHTVVIFYASRAHLIGISAALLFLIVTGVFYFVKLSSKMRFWVVGLVLAVVSVAIMNLYDGNALRSMFDFQGLHKLYQDFEQRIDRGRGSYVAKSLPYRLYNDNSWESQDRDMQFKKAHIRDLVTVDQPKDAPEVSPQIAESSPFQPFIQVKSRLQSDVNPWESPRTVPSPSSAPLSQDVPSQEAELAKPHVVQPKPTVLVAKQKGKTTTSPAPQPQPQPLVVDQEEKTDQPLQRFLKKKLALVLPPPLPQEVHAPEMRNLDEARNNIFFRFFIWKDMWHEIWPNKIITGVGFGHPQRSPSIEILRWAYREWNADGWITPHNFFLHVIYRAGIVGLLLLVFMVYQMGRLTRMFIQKRDFGGVLLISILIYWCVMSTFSVTLEFPNYAIFFWTLFGMISAYARKHRELT